MVLLGKEENDRKCDAYRIKAPETSKILPISNFHTHVTEICSERECKLKKNKDL